MYYEIDEHLKHLKLQISLNCHYFTARKLLWNVTDDYKRIKPHNGFSKLNCRKYKLKLKTYVLSCSVPNRDLVLKLIRLTRVISVSLGWNLTCLVSWWAILLSLIVRLVKLSFSNPWYFELLEGLKSFFLLKQKFLTTQSLVLKLIQAYLWNKAALKFSNVFPKGRSYSKL